MIVQPDGIFRTRHQTGIAPRAQIQINRVVAQPFEFKGPQPADQRLDLSTEYGITPLLHRASMTHRVPGTLREKGHVKIVAQQVSGMLCGSQLSNDQEPPCALVGDCGNWLWFRKMRRGQQCRDFWAGVNSIPAPAAGFPDIDEPDWRVPATATLAALTSPWSLFGQC